MIVEVETVNMKSDVWDYIDNYEVHEIEKTYKHSETDVERTVQVSYVVVDTLSKIISEIGNPCIVHDPEGVVKRHDDAEWFVRVYDGYNE